MKLSVRRHFAFLELVLLFSLFLSNTIVHAARDDIDDDDDDDERDRSGPKLYVKPNIMQYTEVVDLMVDVAREECEKLGALVTFDFDYKGRCEMFSGEVEDLIGVSDTMVKELKLTQKQMLKNSQASTYMLQLRLNMRSAAKKALSAARKREDDVRKDLQRDMMRWVMEVATRADTRGSASSFNNMGNNGLSAAQLKTISEMMSKKGLGSFPTAGGGVEGKQKSLFDTSAEDEDWAERISARLRKAAREDKKHNVGSGSRLKPKREQIYASVDDPDVPEKAPGFDL